MSKTRDLANLADLNFDSGTMVVDKVNDRVGIGTSSPAVQVHATGVGRFSQLQMTNNAGAYTSGSAGLHLFGFSDNNLYFNWFDAGAIIFRNNGANERMRITSAGNVGIGRTSPNEKLAVSGNIELYNDEQDGYIWFHDAGTRSWTIGSQQSTGNFVLTNAVDVGSGEKFVVNSGGSVGIGTSSPSGGVQLDVRGTGVLQLVNTDTVQLLASNGGSTLKNVSNNPLLFGTNNTERLRITSTGKLETSNRDYGFFNHATNVTLADDASIVLNSTTLGVGMLVLYEVASGSNVLFRVGYGSCAAISGAGGVSFASADTDGAVCVFSSGHTLTIKNRLGSSRGFTIAMFCAGNNFAG